MTLKQALTVAQGLWGKPAGVQRTEKSARIGTHGEYVALMHVSNKKDSPKFGHYRCATCSTVTVEGDDVIVRDVWHRAGGWQTAYKVGRLSLGGMFFSVEAEAESFEAAFAIVAARKASAA